MPVPHGVKVGFDVAVGSSDDDLLTYSSWVHEKSMVCIYIQVRVRA